MSSKRENAVFFSLLTAFLVLAATYGGLSWKRAHSSEPNPHAQSQASPPSTPSPTIASAGTPSSEKLIAQLKTTIGGTLATLPGATAPHAQVPGFSFYTAPIPKESAQVAFPRDNADLMSVYKAAQTTLQTYGLKPTTQGQTADATSMPILDYSSDTIFCELGKAAVTTSRQAISVSCADKTDYIATSQKVKPLYDLYVGAQTIKPTSTLYFSDFTPSNSTIQGYAHAELNITEGNGQALTALFYQTPDKNWHFFKGAQSQLACTDFNTQELRNAYLGQACYTLEGTTQKQSTVQ